MTTREELFETGRTIRRSADAHREILRQIEKRSADGVRRPMHRHIVQVGSEIGRARGGARQTTPPRTGKNGGARQTQ